MTPEERAQDIAMYSTTDWLGYTSDGDDRWIDHSKLEDRITTAIKEAIQEERQACIDTIQEFLNKLLHVTSFPHSVNAILDHAINLIRKRGEP